LLLLFDFCFAAVLLLVEPGESGCGLFLVATIAKRSVMQAKQHKLRIACTPFSRGTVPFSRAVQIIILHGVSNRPWLLRFDSIWLDSEHKSPAVAIPRTEFRVWVPFATGRLFDDRIYSKK